MYKNYNRLGSSRDTWLKDAVGTSPTSSVSATRTSWLAGLLLMVCCLFGVNSLMAQAPNTYAFAASTGTFTAGGGTASTATGDDGTQTGIVIGFNFTYNATTMTQFGITTNGNIRLGTSAATTAPASFTNSIGAATTNTIAPMWDDNHRSAGAINYIVTGSSPNRVLTVTWTNVSIGGGGSTSNSTSNYQVKLFETTNIIQLIYGAMTAANGLSASIGIAGASGNFISVTPAATPTTSTATANNSISAVTFLPTGTIYTFTPPLPCSGTPTPGTITSTASVCIGAATGVTIAATGFSTGVTGITFQWEESATGLTGSFVNAVGGSGSTTTSYTTPAAPAAFYRMRITCANGGGTATTNNCAVTTTNCNFDVTLQSSGASYTSIISGGTVMSGWQNVSGELDDI